MLRLSRPARAAVGLALTVVHGCSSPATGPAPASTNPTGVAPVADDARSAVRVRACEGPATSLPSALAAGLRPPPAAGAPGVHLTIDDELAALARRAPGGFAGVFYDAQDRGQPVLLLTDPARASEAKAALASGVPHFPVAAAEVRGARWDFAQLYDWYRYLREQGIWNAGTGLTATDIDERANRLYLGTADQAARDRMVDQLGALGLPCDLVLVGISPPVQLR
jgi:hypothetical protein